MTPFQYARALGILRTKTAASAMDVLRTAKSGVGHLFNAANIAAQAGAGHLESVGAPKALTGLMTAAPTLGLGYGVYKGGKGAKDKLDQWKYQRQLRAQGYDQ